MASGKLFRTIRRNELLLLASLLAGLVMALVEMAATWATGAGLWTFPGYVSAVAYRSLQTAGAQATFSIAQIVSGLGIHLVVAVLMGVVFSWIGPGLRSVTGLDDMEETPAYGLLGAGFGMAAFAVAWWGVLPSANPVMVAGLDPTFFGIAHGVWGLALGVTRKAWVQTAPQVQRRASSPSPQPTPAGSAHKAPSTSPTPPASSGSTEVEAEPETNVATLQPEPSQPEQAHEPEDEAAEAGAEAETAEETTEDSGYGGEHERWSDKHADDEASADSDELSPWPDPPDPDEDEGETGSENGYASRDTSTGRSTPDPSPSPDADADEAGLNMTDHARRSLQGLTNREPYLPPVHKALNTTLTHVAPGRAVCTLEADESLHDATGAVQPGVLTSLAELAATIAAQTALPDAQHATVSSSVKVEGSIEEGHVVAEAEVTEQAGTTTITEVEVRDATGKVLVDATFQAASAEDE